MQMVNAQTGADNSNAGVVVIKDPRIEMLVNKQAEINDRTVKLNKRTDKGYRLMIISTTNREEALAAKTKIYTLFPELQPYLWHQNPYYKLKAGNFTDKKEAESYQRRLNAYFPKGVHLMNDVVEVKPKKESD